MRLSTSLIYEQSMNSVVDAQSSWLRTGKELSTGKKISTPSDDPIAASQAIVISQAQAQNKQYSLARTFATQRESLEDNILNQVVSVIQSAMEKVIQSGNSTLSDENRGSLATDLEGIRNQLLNLANSTDGNGRYIFAGYQTENPPFAADATTGFIDYNGGERPVEQQVDADRTMLVGHTGRQIFITLPTKIVPEPAVTAPDGTVTVPPSEANVFTTLNEVIAALKIPVTDQASRDTMTAAIDKANRGLRNSFNNVLTVHAQVGVQLSELGNLDNLSAEKSIGLTIQRSRLEDVDWNAAISDYKLKMYALNASYQAFTDMKGLSLFSINR